MKLKELIKRLHLKEQAVINSDGDKVFICWERCFCIDGYVGCITINEHGNSFYFYIEKTDERGEKNLLYKVVSYNSKVFELVIEEAEKDLKIKI